MCLIKMSLKRYLSPFRKQILICTCFVIQLVNDLCIALVNCTIYFRVPPHINHVITKFRKTLVNSTVVSTFPAMMAGPSTTKILNQL